MVVTAFSVTDKANQVKFFEKSFLVANISPKRVIDMLFLTLSSANVDFLGQELNGGLTSPKKLFQLLNASS